MGNLKFLDQLHKLVSTYKSIKPHRSVFYKISDNYYHENFHSDILAFYLSNDLTKRIFIKWLNKGIDNPEDIISYQAYKNGAVKREKNRIDITLFNENNSKAIIIENKSNNANDQIKQLYRYYRILENQNITVEKICYINKSSNKKPDLSSLNKKDIDAINNVLKVTRLDGPDSLITELLEKVIIETEDIKLNALSRELISLFKYIIYGDINMDDLQYFVEELKKDENKSKLDDIIVAYKDIPVFLANKYEEYLLEKKTKYKIWVYENRCLVIENILYKDKNFAIDIWFSTNDVDISYLVRNGTESDEDSFKQMLGAKLPFSNERIEGRYRFFLSDPLDEEAIKHQIDELLSIVDNIKLTLIRA